MLVKAGMWIWGTVTVVSAIVALGFVVVCGFYIDANGHFTSAAPQLMPGLYTAMKDNSGLVAGVLGFSALAWARFFDSGKES